MLLTSSLPSLSALHNVFLGYLAWCVGLCEQEVVPTGIRARADVKQKISVKGSTEPAKLWTIYGDRSLVWHLFHILSPHSLDISCLAASFSWHLVLPQFLFLSISLPGSSCSWNLLLILLSLTSPSLYAPLKGIWKGCKQQNIEIWNTHGQTELLRQQFVSNDWISNRYSTDVHSSWSRQEKTTEAGWKEVLSWKLL